MKNSDVTFNGVLVSGDIAFSGQVEEYADARAFLNRVCDAIDIQHSEVWTVPGNHDANRDKIDFSIRNWHTRVKANDDVDRQRVLDEMLKDHKAEHLILGTLQNYNDFAERYSCGSKVESPLYWRSEKQVLLNDGSKLKIWGINSAFACDEEDRRGSGLFVGEQQRMVPQEPGVTWIVMCHHPESWLADGGTLMEMLRNRAAVALFGHEHWPTTFLQGNLMTLHAGAVNPERGATHPPSYNVVSFEVDHKPGRQLVLEVQRRTYDSEQAKFVPYHFDEEGGRILTQRIPLPPFQAESPPHVSTLVPQGGEPAIMTEHDEAQVKRRLIYYFFDLVEGSRMTVVDKLQLITPELATLKGRDLFLAIIDEAQSKGKLIELWQEVAQQVEDMPLDPFRTVTPHA